MKIANLTLRARLLLLVGAGFTFATLVLAITANKVLTAQANQMQSQLVAEHLDSILSVLQRKQEMLEKTGMPDVYRSALQESARRELSAKYYPTGDVLSFPFILDAERRVVMHPLLPPGDDSLVARFADLANPPPQSIGEVEYESKGVRKWALVRSYAPWGWTLFYSTPLSAKYGVVRELHTTLLATMVAVAALVLGALSLMIALVTKPIHDLTGAALRMVGGELDVPIDVRGAGEIGILAQSFAKMRDAVRLKIHCLDMEIDERKKVQEALGHALQTTEQIIDSAPFALVLVDADERIRQANEFAGKILGASPVELVGQSWAKFAPGLLHDRLPHKSEETAVVDTQGKPLPVLLSVIPVLLGNEAIWIEAFLDLTERKQLEAQLRHAQKLEAVGQLASGIAHEINTPAQFVGDNIHFLAEAYAGVKQLMDEYRQVLGNLTALPGYEHFVEKLKRAEEGADLAYIEENAPTAFARASDGIARISGIVGAMKEFAHPAHREKSLADLNRALKATLTISRNEYKYVADIETEFGDLPPVMCHIGDINQVFLNLLVNAAHAIADAGSTSDKLGRIRVRSAPEGKAQVRIEIEDTGCGIPAEIRDRIFDPFFTTKEVGRGTGQGLAIARNIVVDQHHGSLTFESEVGKGTTFTILLPVLSQ
jgi:PAS domain S-box-containing protein